MDYTANISALAAGTVFQLRDLVAGFPTDCFLPADQAAALTELRAAQTAAEALADTGVIVEQTGSIIGYCNPPMTHWCNIAAGRTFQRT